MVGALRRVLVCSPQTAGWNHPERVARWRELGFHHAPDFATAASQHEALCSELKASGAEIVELPPAQELSLDAVYTHDASLATDFGLILMRPGKANRVGEAAIHGSSCEAVRCPNFRHDRGARSHRSGGHSLARREDVADRARISHQFCGNRADAVAARRRKALKCLSAPLPYGPGPSACLHLMSLISLLDEQTALVDLSWLAVETVELLKSRGFNSFRLTIPSATRWPAMCWRSAGSGCLRLKRTARRTQRLRQAGFDVRTFPGSEICINGSGGPTCLTRPLLRG